MNEALADRVAREMAEQQYYKSHGFLLFGADNRPAPIAGRSLYQDQGLGLRFVREATELDELTGIVMKGNTTDASTTYKIEFTK
jgi:hypothetical protein